MEDFRFDVKHLPGSRQSRPPTTSLGPVPGTGLELATDAFLGPVVQGG
jgi:hypothetical protein